MKELKEFKIRVVTKDEFTKILLDHLVHDKKDWTTENIFDELLREGFPKLDFERLGDSLSKLFVYLPTMAVDIGDRQFIWVVSGNKAILVNKERI